MVIFGASGDLTRRLLMPALYNLAHGRPLSEQFRDHRRRPRRLVDEDDSASYLAEGVRSFVSDTGDRVGCPSRSTPDSWDFLAAG